MSKLRDTLRIERGLQKEGLAPRGKLHLFNETARYTLDQDLGHEAGSAQEYDLDEITRDRLIAHTRQDAALAVFLANEATTNSRAAKILGWIIVFLLGLLLWRIW